MLGHPRIRVHSEKALEFDLESSSDLMTWNCEAFGDTRAAGNFDLPPLLEKDGPKFYRVNWIPVE